MEMVELMNGEMGMTDPMPHHNMTHHMGTDMNHGTGTGMDHGHGHGTDMNHNHGTDMNHGDHMMGGHAMFFGFSLPIRVLFYEWNIVTQGDLAASCVGVFLFGVLYEALKVWRQYLLRKSKRNQRLSTKYKDSNSDLGSFVTQGSSCCSRCFNGWHILQSLLHVVQTTFGMFLMLIYMTYNVWLAVSVSLGAGMGYFLFAWILPTDPEFGDHCQ